MSNMTDACWTEIHFFYEYDLGVNKKVFDLIWRHNLNLFFFAGNPKHDQRLAEHFFRECIDVRERCLGQDHLHLAETCFELGMANPRPSFILHPQTICLTEFFPKSWALKQKISKLRIRSFWFLSQTAHLIQIMQSQFHFLILSRQTVVQDKWSSAAIIWFFLRFGANHAGKLNDLIIIYHLQLNPALKDQKD